LADISDLPGMDDLKAAGLLRKGQILGAFMDHNAGDDDADDHADSLDGDIDGDFLEDAMLDAGFDGDTDA
jgi:segregation and condensation protein B